MYAHYLASLGSVHDVLKVAHRRSSVPAFLSQLAVTSHQLLQEVSRVLLRFATKIVAADCKAADYVAHFLESLGSDENGNAWAFNLIQTLEFTTLNMNQEKISGTTSPAVDLLVRCPKLKDLRLTLRTQDLYTDRTPKSCHDLLQAFGLGPIIHCASLRCVRLGWRRRGDNALVSPTLRPNPEDRLEGVRVLGLWMKEGSSAGGQCVEVVLVKNWVGWAEGRKGLTLFVIPEEQSIEEVL